MALSLRARTLKHARLPLAVLMVALFLVGAVFASPVQAVAYSAEEIAFVQLLNDYRVSQGLDPLLVSDLLSDAAERHSSDMGKYQFFSHYTQASDWFASGASPWDRMAFCGYDFNTWMGENIAAGYDTAYSVFQAWKNSSSHNANLLSPNFKVVGVAKVCVSGSPYGCYWTTDFGGHVDSTAHSVGSSPTTTSSTTTTTQAPTTTTTQAPTTTTTQAPTTTTTAAPTTTTTLAPTTTTTQAPTTTTTTQVTPTTTTTVHVPTTTTTSTTTTTTAAPTTTTTTAAPTTTTTTLLGSDPSPSFLDVSSKTLYAQAILLMAERDVVKGYGNGYFGPYDTVIRQQFAKMVVLALGYPVSPVYACAFKDVLPIPGSSDPLYPAGYIAACAKAGITVGKTVDTFCPYDGITCAQLITMVARAAGLADPPAGYQPPFDNFSAEHYPWARRAAYWGLLDGLVGMGPDFDFWAMATRGEVCQLLAQLISE